MFYYISVLRSNAVKREVQADFAEVAERKVLQLLKDVQLIIS